MCCQFLNLWRILGSTLDCFIIGLRLSFCRSAVFHSENVVVSPFTIIFLVSLCGFVFLFVFLYLNLYWCFSGVSRGNEVRAFSLHFHPEDVTVSSVWFYLTQLLSLILQRWPVACVDVELFSVRTFLNQFVTLEFPCFLQSLSLWLSQTSLSISLLTPFHSSLPSPLFFC